MSNLVPPPTFSPDESLTYYSAQSVNISSATEGSTIHYTLDGSDPSCSSAQFTAPMAVSANSVTRIRAIACVRDGDNLRFSLGTESSAGGLGLDAVGTLVYVARGANGLQIIDFSVPSSPSVLGTYASVSISDVIVSGSIAYAADGAGGLLILDVSNPVSPVYVGAYSTSMDAYKLALDGTTIEVADQSFGLRLIDVSNPSSPSLLGEHSLAGPTQGVTFSGNLVYVSDDDNGVFIFRYKR